MNPGTRARELLDRLVKLEELIEQHRATLGLLERERLVLQTKLRLAGRNTSSDLRGERT